MPLGKGLNIEANTIWHTIEGVFGAWHFEALASLSDFLKFRSYNGIIC